MLDSRRGNPKSNNPVKLENPRSNLIKETAIYLNGIQNVGGNRKSNRKNPESS